MRTLYNNLWASELPCFQNLNTLGGALLFSLILAARQLDRCDRWDSRDSPSYISLCVTAHPSFLMSLWAVPMGSRTWWQAKGTARRSLIGCLANISDNSNASLGEGFCSLLGRRFQFGLFESIHFVWELKDIRCITNHLFLLLVCSKCWG